MYHLLKNHYMGIGLDYALVVIVKAGIVGTVAAN